MNLHKTCSVRMIELAAGVNLWVIHAHKSLTRKNAKKAEYYNQCFHNRTCGVKQRFQHGRTQIFLVNMKPNKKICQKHRLVKLYIKKLTISKYFYIRKYTRSANKINMNLESRDFFHQSPYKKK